MIEHLKIFHFLELFEVNWCIAYTMKQRCSALVFSGTSIRAACKYEVTILRVEVRYFNLKQPKKFLRSQSVLKEMPLHLQIVHSESVMRIYGNIFHSVRSVLFWDNKYCNADITFITFSHLFNYGIITYEPRYYSFSGCIQYLPSSTFHDMKAFEVFFVSYELHFLLFKNRCFLNEINILRHIEELKTFQAFAGLERI